ncbi:MAG: hypothetical protein ACI86X_001654 [Moritella sp.]|jgi:hypothetical protein
MKKIALILTSILMMSSSIMAATTITATNLPAIKLSGITVPNNITLQGEALTLNGAGVRCRLFIDLYVGSLYTSEKITQGKAVLASDEPAAIRLNITSKIITSKTMSKGMREGFEQATADKSHKLDAKIDDFIRTFAEPIHKGDQFTLLSIPGEGLIGYKNGEFLSITAGEAFRKTVLAIWLGDNPADNSLKKDMLND